jgi:hypothetical protein
MRKLTYLRIGLPKFFKRVDLGGSDLTRAHLLLRRRLLHEPGQEASVLINEWEPLGNIPLGILERRGRLGRTGIATQNNDNGLCLCWDESEDENVLATTIVAFQGGFSEGRILVERHVAVLGTNEMRHDVSSWSPSARIAEPLLANVASNDT